MTALKGFAGKASASVALVVLLNACSPSSEGQGRASRVAAGTPDPGISHVHGLGVDPSDGVLYAATHYGLFRVPEGGPATRVAELYQDTMGFTVTGPNTFLGSGHPDLRDDDLPPLLGLIKSTDRAQTWQSVSLLGKADFHALHAAHGLVYGWDATSGTLMVSDDAGSTWTTSSRVPLRDFAVSPDDADALLATTEQGLMRSADRGRTFSPADGPALVVLAWHSSDSLWGLGRGGQVYLSEDGGDSWRQRGMLEGEPEAFAVEQGVLYAAIAQKGILASTDGGRTWKVRYSDPTS